MKLQRVRIEGKIEVENTNTTYDFETPWLILLTSLSHLASDGDLQDLSVHGSQGGGIRICSRTIEIQKKTW